MKSKILPKKKWKCTARWLRALFIPPCHWVDILDEQLPIKLPFIQNFFPCHALPAAIRSLWPLRDLFSVGIFQGDHGGGGEDDLDIGGIAELDNIEASVG